MKILLGVTGGIACYKALEITNDLTKRGIEVQVVMTRHATEFIAPLSFHTLSQKEVLVEQFEANIRDPLAHIHLAEDCDLFVVAPATANMIAKMAQGIADDLLSTSYLAFDGPVLIAPAMNTKMYQHPATQKNLEILRERGVHVLPTGSGRLACGTSGEGKLLPWEEIVEKILDILHFDK